MSALRFFYIKTLKKGWSVAETPYPKRPFHLPSILSQEEVARLIDAALTPYHRILLMTLYATGTWNAELTHLKVSDIDSQRMVIHIMYGLLISPHRHIPLGISFLLLGSGFLYAFYPVFWAMPTMILSEAAAAASFGLIASVAQLGGFAGPYVIGFLNDRTHALTAGLGFIALVYVAAGSLVLSLRSHYSEDRETKNEILHPQRRA